MKVAYVDTSCLVAIAFAERGASTLSRRMAQFDQLLAANLLDAEIRSVFAREQVVADARMLPALSRIIPDRLLDDEIDRVLAAGHVRGAGCWHLAVALYLAPAPGTITFLTLDGRQRTVARKLGFRLAPE
ncbi:MAG TPA: PIN domain-containing protein [Steroidobacteraceae bacterium]|nr:PIN domain-containing protein [Steroidobacteraceae bacterium]